MLCSLVLTDGVYWFGSVLLLLFLLEGFADQAGVVGMALMPARLHPVQCCLPHLLVLCTQFSSGPWGLKLGLSSLQC